MNSVPDRDYLAEMSAAIDAAIPDGDYRAPVTAQQLVERLRVDDPDLLAGWLDLRAPAFMADVIARRSNSLRQTMRVQGPRRAFAEAAGRARDEGDVSPMRPFLIEHVIDEDFTRRQVSRMTAADCRFVATQYETAARAAKLEASFHRAVAKKIGVQTVGDVFTEEQYLAMYRSVTGAGPTAMPSAA